jgi:hypothetical protein
MPASMVFGTIGLRVMSRVTAGVAGPLAGTCTRPNQACQASCRARDLALDPNMVHQPASSCMRSDAHSVIALP